MIIVNEHEKPRTTQPNWFTFLRIALGVIIIWKGINFIRDTAVAESLIEQTGVGFFSENAAVLAYIITYLSLLCGLFILIGFITRVSSMVMIPVLTVAVFFINIRRLDENIFEFILSLIALGLLILFAIKRSGRFSADEYFRRGAAMDRRHKENFG
jgi:putative oxidoreductase